MSKRYFEILGDFLKKAKNISKLQLSFKKLKSPIFLISVYTQLIAQQ